MLQICKLTLGNLQTSFMINFTVVFFPREKTALPDYVDDF